MFRRVWRPLGATAGAGLLLAGVLTVTGGVIDVAPAVADSSGYTTTCTGVPVIGTLALTPVVTTGSLPSTVPGGGPFSVGNYGIELTLPASLAGAVQGTTVTGTVNTDVQVSGPGGFSQTLSTTINLNTFVPNPAPPVVTIIGHGSVPTITAPTTPGPLTVSTTVPSTTTLVFQGSPLSIPCMNSPTSQIAATTVLPPVPTVTAVSPSAGPLSGGTSVTVAGYNLSNASAVNFGSTPAATYTVNSDSSITAVTPAEPAGTVDVSVTSPLGTSAASSNDQFTFTAGPIVGDVNPTSGPPGGGTTVHLSGVAFTGATQVYFGGTPADSFTVDSDTSITAVSPAGTDPPVDITVKTPKGLSIPSSADQFNYVTPQGYWEVGSDGGLFSFGSAQYYGSMGGQPLNAPIVGVASTPDGQGYWEVASDGGLFAFGDAQFFGSMGGQPLNAPIVGMAATPDGGGYWEVARDGGLFAFGDAQYFGSMGGQPLNAPITAMAATPDGGGYWLNGADGGLFAFGDAPFSGAASSSTPAAPVMDMAAVGSGGGPAPAHRSSSPAPGAVIHDNPLPPTVTSVSPNAGPLTGGHFVVVKGTGFNNSLVYVAFGNIQVSYTQVLVVNNTELIVSPPTSPTGGTVDVTVQNFNGTSATSPADQYTFTNLPTVSAVSPIAGTPAGGNTVTVTGSGFDPVNKPSVNFGANTITPANVTVNSPTSLSVPAPSGTDHTTVDVTVTDQFGQTSPTSAADHYTYADAPTVTGVSPDLGSIAGGTHVTISGTDLGPVTGVSFGSTPVPMGNFTANADGTVTATAPPGSGGQVDITVTTPLGTSAITKSDLFTYADTPAVTGVKVNSGPGGTVVTVNGHYFTEASSVKFGSTPATDFGVLSSGIIIAIVPPGSGAVDVTVTTPLGTSATGGSDTFTYSGGGGTGYWQVGLDGGIFAYGGAGYYGSMGGQPLNAAVVGMTPTPDGKGYWEVAFDGGLFAFGDAAFFGSMGGQPLNAPIVGIAAPA